jgi:hypothetical protein
MIASLKIAPTSDALSPHESMQTVGFVPACVGFGRDEGELVPKMVRRVKLVAELQAGEPTEVELARSSAMSRPA